MTVFKRLSLSLVFVLLMFATFSCEKDLTGGKPMDSVKLYSTTIRSLTDMGLVTGDDSENKTGINWNVGGTDLGIPIYDKANNKMYIAFGDTFSGNDQTGNWRSNIMAVTTDLNASDGITIDSFLNNDRPVAKQFIDSKKVDNLEITTIPTGGIVIGNAIYVHYMSVRVWGLPGEWDINYNGVVKSTDQGLTWQRVNNLTWAESKIEAVQVATGMEVSELNNRIAPNFLQVFPIKADDGFIYIFGIPGGRSGGAKMGRVLEEKYEDFAEYEYFTGYNQNNEPIFVKGKAGLDAILNNDNAYVISPKVAEISVMYNKYLGKWMALYQVGDKLIYRTADNPWGVWSKHEIVTTYAEFPILYCGFMHEVYSEQNGKVIYFLMSQWAPIYNSRLMRLEFN